MWKSTSSIRLSARVPVQGRSLDSRIRPLYDKILAFYRERSSQFAVREIVMIRVQTAQPIDSPAYDLGLTEEEVRDRMERHFQSLRVGRATSQTVE
jgi:hypothetical protein